MPCWRMLGNTLPGLRSGRGAGVRLAGRHREGGRGLGLLNRRLRPFDEEKAQTAVYAALKPPYAMSDLLLAILTQLAAWIPAQGYYGYTADLEDHQLTLKVTRTPSSVASVGPNYAGLVLGSEIRPVRLEISPPVEPWKIGRLADGSLECALVPGIALNLSLDAKMRVSDPELAKVLAWLKRFEPLLTVIQHRDRHAPSGSHAEATLGPDSIQTDLWFQIPRVMELLANLGAQALKLFDGYLAVWNDPSNPEMVWSSGRGAELFGLLSPISLYAEARSHQYIAWGGPVGLPRAFGQRGLNLLIAIPLPGTDQSTGILTYFSSETMSPDAKVRNTLSSLGTSLRTMMDSRRAALTMSRVYLDALLLTANLLDQADPYNQDHHHQVARLAARLAIKSGLSADRVQAVEVAGRLHDVGMVAVALELTTQRGTLAEQSRELIQRHPKLGFDLLKGLPNEILASGVAQAIYEHHERFDGQGYPRGAPGADLTIEGKILAAAEQFVARISNRSYREGLPVDRALYEIKQLSGRQLDPAVVTHLLELYQEAGIRPAAAQF